MTMKRVSGFYSERLIIMIISANILAILVLIVVKIFINKNINFNHMALVILITTTLMLLFVLITDFNDINKNNIKINKLYYDYNNTLWINKLIPIRIDHIISFDYSEIDVYRRPNIRYLIINYRNDVNSKYKSDNVDMHVNIYEKYSFIDYFTFGTYSELYSKLRTLNDIKNIISRSIK